MNHKGLEYFSNLYIDYYYGSYTHCSVNWKEHHIVCPFSKFYYITNGECEINIEGKSYHGQKGRWFFIPSQTRHSYNHISQDYVTKYWIHFEMKAGDERLINSLKLPIYVDVENDEKIVTDFQDIFDLEKEGDLASSLHLKARILDLFSEYLSLSNINSITMSEVDDQKFHQMLTYLGDNLKEKLTIEELSSFMHIHPNYFIRLFKKKMGITPLQYINRVRIERAKSLLENTNHPVSDIMLKLGFNDLSTFSKFFKHYSGYSPKSFRRAFGRTNFYSIKKN